MRGRISTWASLWTGRPLSSTVKVTSEKLLGQLPVSPLSQTLFTLSTLPTLTPAIRTGESLRMLAAFLKTAWSS